SFCRLFLGGLPNSFIDELQRLDKVHPYKIPRLLVKYLLGHNDFYKIIAVNKRCITYVQCFNLYGTLNKPAGNVKPKLNFQILKLPTKFLDISFKDSSKNTIIVTCDEGWSISMRIHNASSKVEPSLKNDVNIIRHPVTIYTTYVPWNLKE
ncbi:HaeIII family restriction endonuclease, partial [Rickettsia sp. TH2014]|uniref:HaeIII family restriction endonuclease n=1 Tax=Rickettsia sp. TH2014 TaxID=1967503 RepID=UPI001C4797BE